MIFKSSVLRACPTKRALVSISHSRRWLLGLLLLACSWAAAQDAPAPNPAREPPAGDEQPAEEPVERPASEKEQLQEPSPETLEQPDQSTDAPEQEGEPADEETASEKIAVEDHEALYRDIAVLTEALILIRRHYITEKTYQELLFGAIDGMLHSLDPHSGFLDPRAFESLREETAGSFSGIGIQIGVRNGVLVIIAPIEGSPAFHAGLLSGDRISAIDGRRTSNVTIEQAVGTLRGEVGSMVTLTIEREGVDSFEVEIVRDEIKLSSVKGARMLADGIGYIRITQFSEPAPSDFAEALEKLRNQGIEALVLDLRNNPGGLLSSAVAVSELLLPRGLEIVSVRGRDGTPAGETRRATGRGGKLNVPIAVLINRGSASASEIVAGALQDHRRAVIVGERSFGKASVQNVVPLRANPNTAVRLTTGYYHTPGGRLIHEEGIEPDIAVTLSPREWRRVQLARAYEEQPDVFPEAEREDVGDVQDLALMRAVDALKAVIVFGER